MHEPQIPNYRIVRKLGAGGMGAVFEAVHTKIERRVAIKILYPELSANPEVTARFLNEARAANLVQHTGIVDIYEFGQTEQGIAFIIMEFLKGESLRACLRHGPLGLAAVLLFRQIALAVAAAHAKNIVHRDLKPDNVMLLPAPEFPGGIRVKVLDFGIAKLAPATPVDGLGATEPPSSFRTSTGTLMGTPAYMSPEQCRGAEKVTDRSDVYSLGVMLYEALAGKLPFSGEVGVDYIFKHLREEPTPLSQVTAGLPAALEQLVETMLAKNAEERPSMSGVATALASIEQSQGLGGVTITLNSAASEPLDPAGPTGQVISIRGLPATSLVGPRHDKRRTRLLLAGGGAAILILGGTGLLLRSERSPQPEAPVPKSAAVDRDGPSVPAPPPPAPTIRWSVQSEPPGAQILRADTQEVLGVTPWQHDRPAGHGELHVLLRAPGYLDKALSLDQSTSFKYSETLSPKPASSGKPIRKNNGPGHKVLGKDSAASKDITNATLKVVD